MAQRFDVQAVTGAVAAALAEGERATRIVAKLETGQLVARDGKRIPAMSIRNAWRYVTRARQRLTAPEDGQQLRPGDFLRQLAEKEEEESPDVSPAPASVPETLPNATEPEPAPEPPPSPRELLIRRVVGAVASGRPTSYAYDLAAYLRSAGNDAGLIRLLEKLEAQHRDADCLGVIREALRSLRPPQPVRRAQRRDRHPPLPRRSAAVNRYSWERMTGTKRLPG